MPPVVIRIRRDTSVNWANRNPVLRDGEPGLDKTTNKIKIGDGFTPWNSLDYVGGALIDDPDAPVPEGQLGVHVLSSAPHPVYDNMQDITLLYENAKV